MASIFEKISGLCVFLDIAAGIKIKAFHYEAASAQLLRNVRVLLLATDEVQSSSLKPAKNQSLNT